MMAKDLIINISWYLIGGVGFVVFIFKFPLMYLQQFKRSMFILKTASFKLKAKQDPNFMNKNPQERKKAMKQDQLSYNQESDDKINQEALKQTSPNYQFLSILMVVIAWPLILSFFAITEVIRVIYLTHEDLGGF